MKELNIFFFGFGQVAKEFTKKLLSEKYKLNISITTRQASGDIEFLGQKVSNFEFNNEKIDKSKLHNFIDTLNVDQAIKKELKKITPYNYTGI